MHQRGVPVNQKSGRAHVTLSFPEAPLMRLSVGRLRQVVKRDLPIEFVPQQLTSYGGLELLHRYVRRLGLYPRLRRTCADLGGDYSGARLSLLLLALLYVGARRVEHLKYLVGDPLVRRFSGLARMPTARTVTNWLRRFTHATLRPLVQLNQELVLEALARLAVPRWTLRCRRAGRPHRRHRGLGLPGLQSPSPQGSQLLPPRGPRRADGPHPAAQKPPGQRARLQAVGRVPPGADRGRAGPPGPIPAARIPHGCRVFPARRAAPARRPRLRLRHQGRLLELAAPQAPRGRAAAVARAGAGRDGGRGSAGHPAMEAPVARDDLPQACPAREPQELPTRSVHPG